MLAGIPEVDLGIKCVINLFEILFIFLYFLENNEIKISNYFSARMNNIIETEKKKNEMLNEAMGKRRRLMTEEDKS